MTSPLIQNFSVAANTDEDIIVTITTQVPGDTLVGVTVYWRLFEQQFGIPVPNVNPILEKSSHSGGGITILDSPPMTFRLTLLRGDTVGLLRNYYQETTVVDAVGNYSDPECGIMTVTPTENRP
jgi:hypothetical protein